YAQKSLPKTTITRKPINIMLDGAPAAPVRILNSARPDAPKVLYVVPFYDWHDDPGSTAKTVKRSRVSGLRVYLARPWYSSGDGERLGVVYLEGVRSGEHTSELQ